MDADRSVSRIKCLVPSCRNSRNRNPKLSFHTFPKINTSLVGNITESGLKEKIDRYKAWNIKLKLHKSPPRTALVYYLHFKRDDFLLPGLPLSLTIGMKYGKHLCRKYKKPFIPIHHMEAHALTARMHDRTIEFPFLVLLISGGHCLLAIAKRVDKFLLLGTGVDDAPGEAFDKMARRMKLKNLPEYSKLSGGQAIELAASKADNPLAYNFTIPLLQQKNCNFSFSGTKNQLQLQLYEEEKEKEVAADGVIPGVNNMCAGFQVVVTRHICHRVQRGMEYAEMKGLIPPDKKTLVVSGGVACNNFIAKGLQMVCDQLEYKMVRPPPKLCTDNGVMIAWNGVERWKENIGIYTDFEDIDIEKSSPLGESLIEDVENAQIKCNWTKLTRLNLPQST